MKTLHQYLTGQVAAALLLTVAVFTAVLLVGNALQQLLTLLASSGLSPWLMVRALLYLIPFVWVFALPMGMLTATLLVFGRFSADQELTAARASGISLLSLIMPILLLSLFCCTLSAYFNMDLGPRCRVAYLQLVADFKSELLNAQIPEGRPVRDFPGYIFYVDKNDGGNLQGVKIFKVANETNVIAITLAESGKLWLNQTNNKLLLELYNLQTTLVGRKSDTLTSSPKTSFDLDLTTPNKTVKPKVSDMTFLQLQQELRKLESLNMAALPQATGANDSAELRQLLQTMQKQQKDLIEPVRVAMHRQIALSFACFGFALVGIPLGIRVHRRETNIGMAIALVLVAIYYGFIMLALSLSGRPEFYPHLILWVPNLIFQATGAVLLWRANRGI